MDSMKASLRLMRSSRSISYWDLGAAGMFDGILRDARGGFAAQEAVPRAVEYGMSRMLCSLSAARAAMAACVGCIPRLAATAQCSYGVRVRKLRARRRGAAQGRVIYRRQSRTQHWCGCADHNAFWLGASVWRRPSLSH